MRKIVTREIRERKTKKNQLLIGAVLIGLMLFSVIGYALGGRNNEENREKIEYNDIEFIQDNSEYWNFNIQEYDFITKYNPEETRDISFLNSLTINNYINKPLYFVGNSQEPFFEISRNLENFAERMQNACLTKQDCEGSRPVKNCSVDNMIIIQEPINMGNESIYQEENCIFIVGNLNNQTKYADAFLFDILGI